MTGYAIRNTPNGTNHIHVYRPGESDPAFMVPTITEALDLIEIDRAQPKPLSRCVGCVEGECPCLPQ